MSMSMSERGRRGGQVTFQRYGAAHMAQIGRRGLSALAARFYGHSRRRALEHLNGKSRVKVRYLARFRCDEAPIFHDLMASFGLADEDAPF
jgi:hypothetical protein